ncbi:condensation domain-containing protein [Microbispora sp. NPDC046933]|uniref:condensation domain-containing protein n=1 Tax=Microbispora sp. NPDC046933 TaxID=3155618 RepID=UPI0033FD6593
MNIATAEIRFSTLRSGAGPMTWGQEYMWNLVRKRSPDDAGLNLGVILNVPEGTGLPDVLRAIQRLIECHDSLRTIYRGSAGGERMQLVLGTGQLVAVIKDSSTEDPNGVAREMLEQLTGVRFEVEHELPIRVGIVSSRGRPLFVVLALSHMATDAHGLGLLIDRLYQWPTLHPAEWQALQQAALETSNSGLAVSRRSLRHWSYELERFSPFFAGIEFRAESPRYWVGRLVAPAIPAALAGISRRFKVTRASVALAAVSVGLAHYTGKNSFSILVHSANRFTPEAACVVAQYSQEVPLRIDTDPTSFKKTVMALNREATRAYTHARCSPEDIAKLCERMAAERDSELDLAASLNIVSQAATGRERTADIDDLPLEELETTSRYEVVDARDHDWAKFYMVFDMNGSINMMVDTTIFKSSDMEGFLRGVQRVLVRVAQGDDDIADIEHFPTCGGRLKA